MTFRHLRKPQTHLPSRIVLARRDVWKSTQTTNTSTISCRPHAAWKTCKSLFQCIEIDGLTYIVKKEDIKKHKEELYYRLRDPKWNILGDTGLAMRNF